MGKKKLLLLFGCLVTVDVLVIIGILYSPQSSPKPRFINHNLTNASPNVKSLFSPSPLPQQTDWTMLLTGDIIPARVVNQKMVAKKDFLWPLLNIKDILKSADLTLINLEAPLIQKCPLTSEGFKFCGEADFAQSLFEAGVDVANLANNHSLNYGWEGVNETEQKLQSLGIETTGFTTISTENRNPSSPPLNLRGGIPPLKIRGGEGALCEENIYCSKLAIKQVQNIKVGFLGYNAVGQQIDRVITQEQFQSARSLVDVLVVSVHWGKEYVREPQAAAGLAPDDPKELGKLFIDWGADIVAGNHPHWYQKMEWVGNKLIIYAQGNTVFDQEWSAETKVGYLLKLHFQDAKIIKDRTEVIPIGIKDYGQAFLLEGEEKAKVIKFLQM